MAMVPSGSTDTGTTDVSHTTSNAPLPSPEINNFSDMHNKKLAMRKMTMVRVHPGSPGSPSSASISHKDDKRMEANNKTQDTKPVLHRSNSSSASMIQYKDESPNSFKLRMTRKVDLPHQFIVAPIGDSKASSSSEIGR